MLGWLKNSGSQSGHPMADVKGAAAVLAALPAGAPLGALEVLSGHLETLVETSGIRSSRLLEIIDQVDVAAKPLHRRLLQDFIAGAGGKGMEARIAHVAGTYWLRLFTAYAALLELHESGDTAAGAPIRGQLGIVCARSLRAAGMHLKWKLFRYGAAESGFWSRVGRVLHVAEARGVAAGKVTVYAGVWGESTVQREFLRTAMLSVSSTDRLPAVHVEVVDRLAAQFSESFVLQKQAASGCHFWIDTAEDRAPARMADRIALSPSLRFFGPGNVVVELEGLSAYIRANGAIPTGMNLGGSHPLETVLEVVRHLGRYWAPSPPARRDARSASRLRIDVVHGLAAVLAAVAGATAGSDSDFDADELSTDAWVLADESAGGFGARASAARTDWLQIGTLLGTRYEEGASWGVGIVRRINLDAQGNRHVGIEMFAKGVTAVRLLQLLPDGNIHPDEELGQDALLLPSAADNSLGKTEVTLLMPLGGFSPQRSHGMRMHSMDYLLVPRRLLEAGQDFDLAEYRILHRSP